MADFRRVVTALAVVVLLMGFAQTASAQPFNCTASSAVPPLLRGEGLTELTGDILLTCSGTVPSQGIGADQQAWANFRVFYGTQVTSRLLDGAASEAALIINEPAPGDFDVCPTPEIGCILATSTANTFQGLVVGNSVEFRGVPLGPPGSVLTTRVFRITNVRANANAVSAGASGLPGQLQAFISITGPSSVPINNPAQTVGFIQNGLTSTTSAGAAGVSAAQCEGISVGSRAATVRFAENFPTAFKVQGTTAQNAVGAIFNTESGLVIPGFQVDSGFVTRTAGLADFGTRLRATFANIPSGVRVWVSTQNVAPTGSVAQLTGSETGPFGAVVAQRTEGGVDLAEVALAGGVGVAVWEVTSTTPLTTETFQFAIHLQATANVANNLPAPGVQGTVSGSFAPAPPAFTAASGAVASSVLPIPRFIDSGTPRNLIIITVCRTTLLFPFVTNLAGFDTGLAISNTTQDPFGTAAQTGTCTWSFFGNIEVADLPTAPIAAGTTETILASTAAPGFQGYAFAVCNFQLAHGFAFVSDVGARNLAMGYLALVVPDPPRDIPAEGESLGQ